MEVDGLEVQFGDDTSGYQPDYDYLKSLEEGYVFSFIKCSEGTDWKSSTFHKQIARARAANKIVAAYHYMNGNDAEAQIRNVTSMIGKDTPLLLDVEWISATQEVIHIDTVWGMVNGLHREGYTVAFSYIPEWYWRDWMGKPDLTGLPLNWRSWYPDNVVRTGIETLKRIPEHIFTDMIGGLATAIVQITSSGRVGNYPNGRIDLNVFRGSLELLGNLLEGMRFMSVWDELLDKTPTGDDPRTEAPAGEFLRYLSVAVWEKIIPMLETVIANQNTMLENDASADIKADKTLSTLVEIKEALDNAPPSGLSREDVEAIVESARLDADPKAPTKGKVK